MFEALCKQWKKRSGPMNLKIVRKERNKMFPEWTSDLTQLFPSQIIPDKIITPTVIKGGKVEYVCNVESCAEADVSFPHSGFLYLHFQQHHSHRYGLPTKFYYACVDKNCRVRTSDIDDQMEAHIKAEHPQLLDPDVTFSVAAMQHRAALEARITERRLGETISSSVDTQETSDCFLRSFQCPVPDCRVEYEQHDHIVWHIGADHEKDWNHGALPQP
ncbi:uncharacterized protein LOC129602261 isoform X1 [Paramacrobiotus metropolitanus]|uniref:uncharacterized protein LOC129602261 isoform X1 n=1 Tax=Paramacrobiotus metropolitanus TaxID=2943436 RepID=UPI0024460F8F|nr:uncharacterized protein LOC129602261 isoform X1 [Paramacrobiotus metropolitanus]